MRDLVAQRLGNIYILCQRCQHFGNLFTALSAGRAAVSTVELALAPNPLGFLRDVRPGFPGGDHCWQMSVLGADLSVCDSADKGNIEASSDSGFIEENLMSSPA